MKDPVIVLNNEMRVVAINPIARKLVRHSEPDPLIGRTALEIFSHTPNILTHTQDLSHKNTEVVFDVDGHPHTYDLRLSAIYQHQRVIGRLIVLRDVTEQKLANARRLELLLEREKSRLLSSFIQYTSHDLRGAWPCDCKEGDGDAWGQRLGAEQARRRQHLSASAAG